MLVFWTYGDGVDVGGDDDCVEGMVLMVIVLMVVVLMVVVMMIVLRRCRREKQLLKGRRKDEV